MENDNHDDKTKDLESSSKHNGTQTSEDGHGSQSVFSESHDEVREIKKMIKEETKVVRNWRWVVLIAMLAVSGGVTVATYFFLSNEEADDFETSVSAFSVNW